MESVLLISEILEWYDMPILFTAYDDNGNNYICLVYETTNDGMLLATGLQVTQDEIMDFTDGKIELLELMKTSEAKGNVFDVSLCDKITAKKRTIPVEEKMFCDKGYYCTRSKNE